MTVCFKPSLPPGEFFVFTCSYDFCCDKNQKGVQLAPQVGSQRRGNLCKLKFVTVDRTVDLQPRPVSGCPASQLHCKVLKILPPTPEYIYMYIKKNPLSISQYTKDLITLQKQQYPLWSIKTNKQKKAYIIFFKSVYLPIITNTA